MGNPNLPKTSTDVLYVHPTVSFTSTQFALMPVGVIGLLNLLVQNGYTVRGINYGIEKTLDPDYDLRDDLRAIDYRVLLVDLHWYDHSYAAMQIAELSKRMFPDKFVVIGGLTTTVFADEILNRFPYIDYAIRGDSEGPLLMLIQYLLRQKGDLASIPNICYRDADRTIMKELTYRCHNLDRIDFTSISFLKNARFYYATTPKAVKIEKRKRFWLCVGRGCMFNCLACDGSRENGPALFARDRMAARSSEALARDMERLVESGIQVICPTHDFEMLGTKYCEKLFSSIKSKGIKPGLYHECFQLPSEKFLTDLQSTFDRDNLKIAVSPLTGDEEVRRMNGKAFSNRDLYRCLDLLAEIGLEFRLYYSANLVGEHEGTFEKTLEQIEDIRQRYGSDFKILCERVVLDPLAPARNGQYGITTELNSFVDYYNYCKKQDDSSVGYIDNSIRRMDIGERLRLIRDSKFCAQEFG